MRCLDAAVDAAWRFSRTGLVVSVLSNELTGQKLLLRERTTYDGDVLRLKQGGAPHDLPHR